VVSASAAERRDFGARRGHFISANACAWAYQDTFARDRAAWMGSPVSSSNGRPSRAAFFSPDRNPSASALVANDR
jgi:hypothetical protein